MKRIFAILAVILLFRMQPVHAAADYVYEDTLAQLIGMEGEAALLPEDFSDPEELTRIGADDLLAHTMQLLREEGKAPLRVMTLLLGVILFSALVQSLRQEGETGAVWESVCTLCAVTLTAEPLIGVFQRSASVLSRTSDFMLGFTGLYGSVIAVSGGVATAALYQGSMAVICGIALEISSKLIFPLLSMSLAMSIVDAVNPGAALGGIIGMIRKLTAWILGLMMSLFLGMLSVQSMVTAAADRAGTKAAKYLISGAIPIVGGAVSDAYAAVLGSMGVLRSGAGMAGILILLSILLPVVLSLGLYRVLVMAAAAAAELFGVTALTRLFRNLENVLSTGFSASVSFGVMFIFSTAVLMLIGTNTFSA